MIKQLNVKWAWHVASMGDRRGTYGFCYGDLREGDHLEDPDIDGRIILKWKKWVGEAWTGLIWLRVEAGGGYL
jgi:hypothetical protein